MPRHPQKKASLVYLGENSQGRHVFFDPLAPDWGAFSAPVATLLEQCDGTRSVAELAALFSVPDKEGDKGDALVRERVEKGLDLLGRGGMLEGTGQCAPKTHAGDRKLETASLYLTRACNLRCKYCFAGAGTAKARELGKEEFLKLVDSLHEAGVTTLTLLGGEPLARPLWRDVAEKAKAYGMRTILLTNGLLVTPDNAGDLARLFDKIQVSLDGPAQANDFFRGVGSHDKAVRGIRELVRAGAEVTVSSVVSSKNLHLLDDFLAFLVKEGVAAFHCSNLQGCGRGREEESLKAPLPDYARKVVELAVTWGGRIDMRFAEAYLKPPRRIRKLNCGVGRGIVEVDPEGVLYPCYVFMEQDMRLGLCDGPDLLDTLGRSGTLAEIQGRSVDDSPLCRNCDFRYVCGGGCLAQTETQRREKCQEFKDFFTWVMKEGPALLRAMQTARGHGGNDGHDAQDA